MSWNLHDKNKDEKLRNHDCKICKKKLGLHSNFKEHVYGSWGCSCELYNETFSRGTLKWTWKIEHLYSQTCM